MTDELASEIAQVIEPGGFSRGGDVDAAGAQELLRGFDAPSNDPRGDRRTRGARKRVRQVARGVAEGVCDVSKTDRHRVVSIDVVDNPLRYPGLSGEG